MNDLEMPKMQNLEIFEGGWKILGAKEIEKKTENKVALNCTSCPEIMHLGEGGVHRQPDRQTDNVRQTSQRENMSRYLLRQGATKKE